MGAFTTNQVKAAPVLISKERIEKRLSQAILVNSGNANACTGKQGLKDAYEISRFVAEGLNISEDSVLLSSTGIIGKPFPRDRIEKNIPCLINSLSPGGVEKFSEAIMTTDTFAKIDIKKEEIGGKEITLCGIAKGAGMIMPNMATMLAFIISDIAVTFEILDRIFKAAVNFSFNKITVDGETSTNDMVLMLANGMAGNKPLKRSSKELRKFRDLLFSVLENLAKMIIKDGEGATKFVEIEVVKARTSREAEKIAFRVANSNLVKASFFGRSLNWGRIMSAVGEAGAPIDADRIDIYYNKIMVVKGGIANSKKEAMANKVLDEKDIQVKIDLNSGIKKSRVFTCDLSPAYVNFNASCDT